MVAAEVPGHLAVVVAQLFQRPARQQVEAGALLEDARRRRLVVLEHVDGAPNVRVKVAGLHHSFCFPFSTGNRNSLVRRSFRGDVAFAVQDLAKNMKKNTKEFARLGLGTGNAPRRRRRRRRRCRRRLRAPPACSSRVSKGHFYRVFFT